MPVINSVLTSLKSSLKGRVVILGVGNTLRGDDGFGSILAQNLKNRVRATTYDGGLSPENYLGKIVKDDPDTVLIIDTVDFGGFYGEIRLFESEEELKSTNFFTTHNSDISLVVRSLREALNKEIRVLGVQPRDVGFSQNPSKEVSAALAALEDFFIRTLN